MASVIENFQNHGYLSINHELNEKIVRFFYLKFAQQNYWLYEPSRNL